MDRKQYLKLLNLKEEIADRDFYVLGRLSENASFTKLMLSAVAFTCRESVICAVDKELREYAALIGADERAEQMTADIKRRYAGFIDERFFNNRCLSAMICAIESGRADSLNEAAAIAERELKN